MDEPTEVPHIGGIDIQGWIDRYGPGETFLATGTTDSKPFVLAVENAPRPSSPDRLLRLAQINSRPNIASPNLATPITAGLLEDGRFYTITPFIEGSRLDTSVKHSVDDVLRIGIAVGNALRQVHNAGIIHCNINPRSILINSSGDPVLTDLGISTLDALTGDDYTVYSVTQWSAPELTHHRGGASAASDVYSLSATLWSLLAGHPPFPLQLMPDALFLPVPAIGRPDVPNELERLLVRAMSKNAWSRPGIDGFVAELDAITQRAELRNKNYYYYYYPLAVRLPEREMTGVQSGSHSPRRKRRLAKRDYRQLLMGWISSWDWPGLLPIPLGSLAADAEELSNDVHKAVETTR